MTLKPLHPMAILLWLIIVCFVLNYSALWGNWRWDDSSTLLHLHKFSIVDTFFNPEVWREFSRTNLMPWLVFSYEVDLVIFGLNPGLFYLHQLLALLAASFALYFVQTLWIDKRFAVLGATLFLVGAPSAIVAQQLMTRHYIEGLLFCLLALLFFVHYLRSDRKLLLAVSVIFYALSVVSKELYVPLVVLLPFLPEATLRKRLVAVIPFVFVAFLYVLWRGNMLGTLTGGYTESNVYLSSGFFPEVMRSFANFPALLFGAIWPLFVLPYLLLVAAYLYYSRSRMLLSGLVLLLVLLPLIPLVRSPGILNADRYLFVFWVAVSFSVAYFADKVFGHLASNKNRTLAAGIALAVLVLVPLSGSNKAKESLAVITSDYDEQAAFIWDNTADLAFEPSENLKASYWFIPNLIEFKKRLLAGASAPLAIPDDIYLDSSVQQLYKYDAQCNCMQDVSSSISERRSALAASTRPDAPLTVEFSYQSALFSWQFGPYEQGRYQIVSNILGVATVPTAGQLGATLQDGAVIYVSYSSPEGWKTYSDALTVVHDAPAVTWQRP